jgi:hypothetical protein
VQQQIGHTDPTLTLRIYQQLLKRKRREEYRERVNELLGTSPAALSRLPDLAGEATLAQIGPQLAVAGGLSGCQELPALGFRRERPANAVLPAGGERRDSNPRPPGPQPGVEPADPPLNPASEAGFVRART